MHARFSVVCSLCVCEDAEMNEGDRPKGAAAANIATFFFFNTLV